MPNAKGGVLLGQASLAFAICGMGACPPSPVLGGQARAERVPAFQNYLHFVLITENDQANANNSSRLRARPPLMGPPTLSGTHPELLLVDQLVILDGEPAPAQGKAAESAPPSARGDGG